MQQECIYSGFREFGDIPAAGFKRGLTGVAPTRKHVS